MGIYYIGLLLHGDVGSFIPNTSDFNVCRLAQGSNCPFGRLPLCQGSAL